ncbi:hypothetical protein PIIN_04261 [Serendipita indica DSM 11827]|uniref:Uncharacterized protein n=1 Tax=Serendipita indica (strain DSM 11827) TaxID=1109443 RepID=G4TG79_SERID|nr:hypothetical protein PIIN_04261 [Serendipita indica DSM 11827]
MARCVNSCYQSSLLHITGFISLVLIQGAPIDRAFKRRVKVDLHPLLQFKGGKAGIAIHTYRHTQSGFPPINALLNLARFYAQTVAVLLASSAAAVPMIDIHGLDYSDVGTATFFLLTGGHTLPADQGTTERDFDVSSSSAILLRQDAPYWCPERFLSTASFQWEQCTWFIWLHSLGDHRLKRLSAQGAPASTTVEHVLVRWKKL